MSHRVILGDCTVALRDLAREGMMVDAVCTDPPYHLASIVARLGQPDSAPIQSGVTGVYARSSQGFMGQQWDGGDVAFRPDTWRRVFDVMKPGAHLVAFAATKGYHRMTCAIEDAGFEIRDSVFDLFCADDLATAFVDSLDAAQGDALARLLDAGQFNGLLGWIYGTGFPKSHNLDGDWEGWGTALKPAIEPIVLAQKPVSESSVAANVARWGVGAINIDASRIAADDAQGGSYTVRRFAPGADVNKSGAWKQDVSFTGEMKPGRWPANVCHDGSDEVLNAFAAYGERGASAPASGPQQTGPSTSVARMGAFKGMGARAPAFHADTGTAARFFYSSKATNGERIFECRECGAHAIGKPGCGHTEFRTHPTVKPASLMEWLVAMVTPPGGLVLDPFAGTGTTAAAAMAAGFQSLSIEADADHVRDIGLRLGIDVADLLAARVVAAMPETGDQLDMFGGRAA